jgi:hypothetical protein
LELGMSHDYVSLLGRQQGINLRSFKTEEEGVEWLKNRLETEDRPRPAERIQAPPPERPQRDPD